MKILIDLRKVSQKPSGIGMYVYQFTKSLDNYDKVKIVGVTDVLESNEIKELQKKGIKIIVYGQTANKSKVYRYNKFIRNLLKQGDYTHFWQPNFIIPYSFKKIHNLKRIITIHDISPICDKQFYGFIYRIYFRIFLKRSINASNIILYDSNDTKEKTEQAFKEASSKLNIVTYIPIERTSSKYSSYNKEYFLYIGNVEKRKGVHLLIDSYASYIRNGGDKNLIIAGGLRDKKIESQYIRVKQELGDKIKYVGYINANQKEKLTNECTAIIFPSFAEGFGMPPLEAILNKKKCIVSDIDVLKEVLEDTPLYFRLESDNYKLCVMNLANALKDIDNYKIEEDKINKIEKKYESKKITEELLKYLLKGGKK